MLCFAALDRLIICNRDVLIHRFFYFSPPSIILFFAINSERVREPQSVYGFVQMLNFFIHFCGLQKNSIVWWWQKTASVNLYVYAISIIATVDGLQNNYFQFSLSGEREAGYIQKYTKLFGFDININKTQWSEDGSMFMCYLI